MICAIAILHHAACKTELAGNFIARLGRVSFSIYLVHGLVLDYLPTGTLVPRFDIAASLLITIVVSFLTERFIERPGIRFSKAVATFRARAPAAVTEPV